MPGRPPPSPDLNNLPNDIEGLKRALAESWTREYVLAGVALRASIDNAVISCELVSPGAAELLDTYFDSKNEPVTPSLELYLDAQSAEIAVARTLGLDEAKSDVLDVVRSLPPPPPLEPLKYQPEHFRKFKFRLLLTNRATAKAWGLSDERAVENVDADSFLATRSPPSVYLIWKSMWIKAVLDGLVWQREQQRLLAKANDDGQTRTFAAPPAPITRPGHRHLSPPPSDPNQTPGPPPVKLEYSRFNTNLNMTVTMQGTTSYSGMHPVRATPLVSTFFTNVSQLKEALKSAAAAKEEIELKNAELQKKNAELKRGEQARMRFVASVSHELRTPMNGIIGLTNTLLEDDPSNLRPEQVEALHLIRQCGDTLLRNVSDILLFSRLTSPDSKTIQLHPHPFHLASGIARACALLELRAQSEGVEFRLELQEGVPEVIVADEARLCGTVLGNLVSNAVKFVSWDSGGSGVGLKGAVCVRVERVDYLNSRARSRSPDEHEHGPRRARIRLSVLDTGPGIPESKQSSIFTPFSTFVSDRFPVATSSSTHDGPPRDRLEVPDAATHNLDATPLELLSPFDTHKGSSSTLRPASSSDIKTNSYLPSEGTGLGLVIVRQVAELMGGQVGFASPRKTPIGDEDEMFGFRGTEFWVELEVELAGEDQVIGILGERVVEGTFNVNGDAEPTVINGHHHQHQHMVPAQRGGLPPTMIRLRSPVHESAPAPHSALRRSGSLRSPSPSLPATTLAALARPSPPPPPTSHQPLAPIPERRPSQLPPTLERPLRVLVAEDNPINLRVLQRFLDRVSRSLHLLDVSTATDGLVAIERYSSAVACSIPPDLVLMDLAMPKVSGIDAAKEIRRIAADLDITDDKSQTRTKQQRTRVKIVACTANVLDTERDECLAGGLMDGFIGKPIAFEELRELVARTLDEVARAEDVDVDAGDGDGGMEERLSRTGCEDLVDTR